jgi:prepilin-type N-terminal cleavage/methylation domain-containing protein
MKTTFVNNRGYTLIEIIMVIVILGIIGGITFQVVAAGVEAFKKTSDRKELYDQGRLAMERMVRELRDAKEVTESAGSSITFKKAHPAQAADNIEKIKYELVGSDLKRVGDPAGTPVTAVLASNVSSFTATRVEGSSGGSVATRVYWSDLGTGKIGRADADGSDPNFDLITGLPGVLDIDVDSAAGKIYWADSSLNAILRADLDGFNEETWISGTTNANYFALDEAGGKVYWTNTDDNKVQRANLDGTDVETLADAASDGVDTPRGIALDVAGGKVYWTETGTADRIRRANLDGTSIENLVSLGGNPQGIALDLDSGKMYFAAPGENKIQRANLDGTGEEDLVSSLNGPKDLALDLDGGKMYWADSASGVIQRANLDGSSAENLVTGLTNAHGVDIELGGLNLVTLELTLQDPNDSGNQVSMRTKVFLRNLE